MNIAMFTNTYLPHVGGVARSVQAFTNEYRKLGHRVMVVAPEFENMPANEEDVVRIPAIQHFNGSDFSVSLPVPGIVSSAIEEFDADIVHAHHPFLLGAAAVRTASVHELPLVFTHHTMYEQYTHYVPGDSPALKRFVVRLSTSYANLCDWVFAPSESIAETLVRRGVRTPVRVVPTGVNLPLFARGDGAAFRAAIGLDADAYIVGHLGRLAPEKNLALLVEAVASFLKDTPRAHFLLVGSGPSAGMITETFAAEGLGDRLHLAGTLTHPRLADAYAAMDVFAFTSKSETQGMVLTEAMACGVPVVAIDAPGAREVVGDGRSGRLLTTETAAEVAAALRWVRDRSATEHDALRRGALATARAFSIEQTAAWALRLYERLLGRGYVHRHHEISLWRTVRHLVQSEIDVLKGLAEAASAALLIPSGDHEGGDDASPNRGPGDATST